MQLFLNYDREAPKAASEFGAAGGTLVCPVVAKGKGKAKRKTRLQVDERRTGKKMLASGRIVTEAGDGVARHERLEEKVDEERGEMIHPGHLDMLERICMADLLGERCGGILRVLTSRIGTA